MTTMISEPAKSDHQQSFDTFVAKNLGFRSLFPSKNILKRFKSRIVLFKSIRNSKRFSCFK